jgi:hypothetical protein
MSEKNGEMEMVFCSSLKECTKHRILLLRAMFDISDHYGAMSISVDKKGTIVVYAFKAEEK